MTYAELKAAGLCVDCRTEPARRGRVRCEECAAAVAARVAAKRAENPDATREWWAALDAAGRARNQEHVAAVRARRRRFLEEVKTTCGCVDCGAREPRMHFDHRDGETKLFTIATRTTCSLRVLIEEIEKCDVRCASCHAGRHGRVRAEAARAKREAA